MATDSNDTDKSTEIDDLSSFGALRAPDTEDSHFSSEAEPAGADLTSLASSSKANNNGHAEPQLPDDDARIDLSGAVEEVVEEADPVPEATCEHVEPPPETSAEQSTSITDTNVQNGAEPQLFDDDGRIGLGRAVEEVVEKADPVPETTSEHVEPSPETSAEQSTSTADTNIRKGSEPDQTDRIRPSTPRTHWVLMISVGFVLGLTAASISIFIFFNMDRSQSRDRLLSPTSMAPEQQAAMQPRVTQPSVFSNANPSPSQSIQPERESAVARPQIPTSESRISTGPQGFGERTSVRPRKRVKNAIEKTVEQRPVDPPPSQPISASNESQQNVVDKPINRSTAKGVTSSAKNSQPVAAASDDLDKIIDRVLDATEDDNIKRSVARKESQRKAAQSPEELPLAPSREQVAEAMTVLLPAIRGCAKGLSGLATANIIVLNNGKVANATVSGSPFAGTASGYCIEGVVRKARFPRFRQPSFRVRFPFSIRNNSP